MVASLATTTGIAYGFGSPFFAISTILALVVMYDARAPRKRATARILNHIVPSCSPATPSARRLQELKELLGHTASEVVVGALVGLLYAVLILNLVNP